MSTNKISRDQLLTTLHDELRVNSTATIMFHQTIAAKLGLNSTDHKCLEVIFKHQPITAGQLSVLTGLTTGAVTGVIDRLEKVGFVFRVKDPEDKRRVIINVQQEKAEQEVLPLFSSFGKEMNTMLSKYNDKEIQIIIDFVKNSNRVLQAFMDK
ncbi:MarR family winged helix-turn-helix transcriptional regulator [Siminovitchia sediminis]|uniref:MarR family winged helix-turn-helix transcriptional regulator n=1 Tax=Siminovitchia sediminis TaxID=1274353 RepID=A0ABW4KM21_9BACI